MTMIRQLPLESEDRAEFISAANERFEVVVDRIEPQNVEITRSLWDAEHFIDNHLLDQDMLPIDRNYALSLIEAFLVHHVIDLAVEADKRDSAATH